MLEKEAVVRIKVQVRRFCASGVESPDFETMELVSEERENYVTRSEVNDILPCGVYIVVNLTTDSHVTQQGRPHNYRLHKTQRDQTNQPL
jgi:hypothetical protein